MTIYKPSCTKNKYFIDIDWKIPVPDDVTGVFGPFPTVPYIFLNKVKIEPDTEFTFQPITLEDVVYRNRDKSDTRFPVSYTISIRS